MFKHFYGSGNRTHKGLVAILNGYPAQPSTAIIKYSKKSENLPFLSHFFNKRGYHTSMTLEENPFKFSRNLLVSDAKSFGFYIFNDGFGYVSHSSTLIYDNILKSYIQKTGKYNSNDLEYGKAIIQNMYDDFNAR